MHFFNFLLLLIIIDFQIFFFIYLTFGKYQLNIMIEKRDGGCELFELKTELYELCETSTVAVIRTINFENFYGALYWRLVLTQMKHFWCE